MKATFKSVDEPPCFYVGSLAKITVELPECLDWLLAGLVMPDLASTSLCLGGTPPNGRVKNFKSSEYDAMSCRAYVLSY